MNSFHKLKYRYFIILSSLGIIFQFIIFPILGNLNNFSNLLDLILFIPLFFGIIGLIIDIIFNINKKMEYQNLKFIYLGLFFGISVFVLNYFSSYLHLEKIISLIYFPHLIITELFCGKGFTSCATNIYTYSVFIIYPLFFSLIGLILDIIMSKMNKAKSKNNIAKKRN